MINVILNSFNLFKYLWEEALLIACVILNFRGDDKTPYELGKGRTPNLNFSKAWDYLVKSKIPMSSWTRMLYYYFHEAHHAHSTWNHHKCSVYISHLERLIFNIRAFCTRTSQFFIANHFIIYSKFNKIPYSFLLIHTSQHVHCFYFSSIQKISKRSFYTKINWWTLIHIEKSSAIRQSILHIYNDILNNSGIKVVIHQFTKKKLYHKSY